MAALGSVGCWEPREFTPTGEGAHPAVPPLPVPASAGELQVAFRVRQPARRSKLQPQHGNLRWAQEQLGNDITTSDV